MTSQESDYTVLLDACVLIPISLTDLLLRLAEEPALYTPKWSKQILTEIESNLQKPRFNLPRAKAKYRIQCMMSAFPGAMVHGYEHLVASMTNSEHDRHVLAAAVHAGADCILTSNSGDFPQDALAPYGIEKLTPDQFLCRQFRGNRRVVIAKLIEQAADSNRPLPKLLELLGKMVPRFAQAVRQEMSEGR